MNILRAAATCVLCTASLLANAQQEHDAVDLLLTMGLAAGGDDLAEIEYEHGSDDEIEAGSGIILGIGAVFALPDTPIDLQFSVNYHGDSADADNGDVSMERTAFDALAFYHTGPHRIGGGITRHSDVEYDADIDYTYDVNVDFDDATGFVIEYNYIFGNFFALGIRHTEIEYEAKNYSGSVDGSHFAIIMDLLI